MCAVLDGSGKTLERAKARVHQSQQQSPGRTSFSVKRQAARLW